MFLPTEPTMHTFVIVLENMLITFGDQELAIEHWQTQNNNTEITRLCCNEIQTE